MLELTAALGPRYRLERPLATGGTTSTWLAHAVDGGQPVVVKVLLPSLAARTGAERFVTEMFAASRFRHPSALPILDAAALELGTGAAALYYVVPWADGESLRTRLEREGLLPVAEALRYGAELAEALAAAHAQGLVHGDVRPENVLLGPDRARLTDFGVARALGSARPATDAAGDIRCLGRVLYEMLAGEPPAGDHPVPLRSARRNAGSSPPRGRGAAGAAAGRPPPGRPPGPAPLAPPQRAGGRGATGSARPRRGTRDRGRARHEPSRLRGGGGAGCPRAGTHLWRAPGGPPAPGAPLGVLHRRRARHVHPDALAPVHRTPSGPTRRPTPAHLDRPASIGERRPRLGRRLPERRRHRGADRRTRAGAGTSRRGARLHLRPDRPPR